MWTAPNLMWRRGLGHYLMVGGNDASSRAAGSFFTQSKPSAIFLIGKDSLPPIASGTETIRRIFKLQPQRPPPRRVRFANTAPKRSNV